MISTNQFKNGNHIEVDGTIFKIVEFQHVKPGKGGAFVRTKLRAHVRRQRDRQDLPRRREVPRRAHRGAQDAVPLRRRHRRALHGQRVLRADRDPARRRSSERAALDRKPNDEVDVLFIDDEPSATCSCRRPSSSRSPRPSRACAATPPPAAATSPRRSRPARSCNVPLFVNIGDRVQGRHRAPASTCRARRRASSP